MNSFTTHICDVLTSLDDRWHELVDRSSGEALIWKPPGSRFHTITQLVWHFAGTQDYMLLHALGKLEQHFGYHAAFFSSVTPKERLIGIINTTDAEKDDYLYHLASLNMDELIDDRDRDVLVGDGREIRRILRGALVLRTVEHNAEHLGQAILLSQLWADNHRT